MDGERVKGEGDGLALAIFENIGNNGAFAASRFLSLDGSRILVPGGVLKDAYGGSYFHIDVLSSDETPDLVVRVSTSNWALTRNALNDGAGCYETIRCDVVDGASSLCSTFRVCGDDIDGLILDIVYACLNLDGAFAVAMAHDAGDNPEFTETELDPTRLFETYGFGANSPIIARDFDEEYRHPYDRVLAAYALPYNLQKVAESGVLDAVIAECDGVFALYRLSWRRWLFCTEIVAALQARGFSNEQIAYVICRDEDLFDGLETRRDAETLCERIRESAFDPEDIDDWTAYLATETGPLAGFL